MENVYVEASTYLANLFNHLKSLGKLSANHFTASNASRAFIGFRSIDRLIGFRRGC